MTSVIYDLQFGFRLNYSTCQKSYEIKSHHIRYCMQAKRKGRKVWAKNIEFPETSQRTFRI